MTERSPAPRQRFTDLGRVPLSIRLGSYEITMLGWGFFEPVWWRNYWHVHSFFEVCYAYQGRGSYRIRDALHTVAAGDVFLARPDEPHEIISAHDDPLGIYFWSFTLAPTTAIHATAQAETPELDAIVRAFVAGARAVSDRAATMPQTLALLTEEIVRREAGYTEMLAALAMRLQVETMRALVDVGAYAPPPLPSRPASQGVADTVMRYLRDNYSQPISLRDIAAQTHMSERHVSRLFRQATGTSIGRYLTALRMQEATRLLLERRLSVKAVAFATGYQDVHSFTTLFRHATGMTPAAFRDEGATRPRPTEA